METQEPSRFRTYNPGVINRVVLADDNLEFMANVSEVLGAGWSVVAAVDNGISALKACSEFSPDFLILDISMGRPNGIEVAKVLTSRDAHPKILFLTIHDEPEVVYAALSAGASGYMLKSRIVVELPLALYALKAGRRFVSPGLHITLGEVA